MRVCVKRILGWASVWWWRWVEVSIGTTSIGLSPKDKFYIHSMNNKGPRWKSQSIWILMKFMSLPSTWDLQIIFYKLSFTCVYSRSAHSSWPEHRRLAGACNPLQPWLTGPLALFVKHRPIHCTHAIFLQARWTRLPASLQLVSPPHTRWPRSLEKHSPSPSKRDTFFAKLWHPYQQYGGGMAAQSLALSFHSNKVQFVFLCGFLSLGLCRFTPNIKEGIRD